MNSRSDFVYPDGATPLDHDELEGLKIGHVSNRGELNRFEQDNINDAFTWLKHHRKRDILTEEFIRTLHKKMFGNVWRWAGEFRRSGKNIGSGWTRIGVDLRNLLDDVRYWIENKTYQPDEIAARFHHRLVSIHIFPNGSGRHARLMTDILLEDIFGKEPFVWNRDDHDTLHDSRKTYLEALRKADDGDYSLLKDFLTR